MWSFLRRHPFTAVGHPPAFWLTYVLSVIYIFHSLLVAYSNSTYMEQFTTPEVIGALYTIGAALAVLVFLGITRVLEHVGNVRLTITIASLEIVCLVLIGLALSPATTIIAFVLFLVLNPLLYLTIDIFSETLIGENESTTGSKRGLTLTLMSLAAVAGPLALAAIVGEDASNLNRTYFVAAGVFSIFVLLTLIHFKGFADPTYTSMEVKGAVRHFWSNRNIRYVFLAHFTLQMFFAYMVIYFPLYLATELNYSWASIGSIIAFGLFAYVLFEYPIGLLADQRYGEKEMMALGFAILIIASAAITWLGVATVAAWMALMFFSRIGASLVEVTTESYFFKHTNGSDANDMSFFRLTRPLAMVAGALLGSATLLYLPLHFSFLVLAVAMIPALFFTSRLVDTR